MYTGDEFENLQGSDLSTGIGVTAKPGVGMGEELPALTGVQSVGRTLYNFGQGFHGAPTAEQQEQEGLRRRKQQKIEQFKQATNALEDGFKIMEKLTDPAAREQFAGQYSAQLETMFPGTGDAFRTLSKSPDQMALVRKYAAKSSTLKNALEVDPSGKSALALIKSVDGMKTISTEMEAAAVPDVQRKVRTMVAGWQQLIPPEMLKRFNDDKVITASELYEANDYIRNHPEEKFRVAALDDAELGVLRKNDKAILTSTGILTGDKEAEVLADRAKRAGKPEAPLSELGKLKADLDAKRISQADYDKKVKKLTGGDDGDKRLTETTISVNGKNILALRDKEGNYFDANTKQPIKEGIGPQLSASDENREAQLAARQQAVTDMGKAVDALEKIAKNHPRSAAGIFAAPARAIEYVSGSVNPTGKPGQATMAMQLRDSIIANMHNLGRLSQDDRKRIENSLQIGPGGNPNNLPEAIRLLRAGVAKEQAAIGAPRGRQRPGAQLTPEEQDELSRLRKKYGRP